MKSKNFKKKINGWLRSHGLRQPDKIDILFGLVSTIFMIFCVVMSTIQGLQEQNTALLSLNSKLMNSNDFLIATVSAYEDEYGSLYMSDVEYETPTFSLLNKNYYEMTKTQMEEHLSELNSFISHFKTYGINETDETYQLVVNEYNKCLEALKKGHYKNPYSNEDHTLLAYAIMREQGDDRNSDECQQLVGCVIMNRKAMGGINGNLHSPSIKDIINEEGQYHFAIMKNHNVNINTIDTSIITNRCYENARKVLEGEVSCPSNVVFQATFKQGSGVYKSFYNEGYGTTTYFCYL